MLKTMRRRVLIREYDYVRMVKRAVPELYDTAEFEPITKHSIEQEKMWSTLQSKRVLWLYEGKGIRQIFHGMRDYLYSERYLRWNPIWDNDNYLCVQSRHDYPPSRMGWGIFTVTYDTDPDRIRSAL